MVGTMIDGIRCLYLYCRNLLVGRKQLKLKLSGDDLPSKSTALIIVNKGYYSPYFESCVSLQCQTAIIVFANITKLTKLSVLLHLQSETKQLCYPLVVSTTIDHSSPPIITLVNLFGNNLFRVYDNPVSGLGSMLCY